MGAATAVAEQDKRGQGERREQLTRWVLDRSRRLDGALVATIALAGVLRFWGIGSQSLWYDEWLTSEAATGSVAHLIRYIGGSAGIPPTYFGFMWGWARVVGDSEAVLRSVSAFAGIATVPLVYALAAELGQRRRVARLAGVLVAVNPMLVWYSQEARPYSIVAYMGGLSLWALARVLTRGERRDLAVWVFVCALTFAIHYYAVLLIAIEVLALLGLRRPQIPQVVTSVRRAPRVWLLSFAPTLVLLVGLAPFAVKQFLNRHRHAWIADHDFGQRLRGVGTGMVVGPSPPNGRIWMAVAAVVLLAVVLLVVRGNMVERAVAAALAALGVGAMVVALLAKMVGVDAVIERYLIVIVVPLAMVAAIGLGLARLPAWVGGAAVAAISALSLVVVINVAQDPELQRTEWATVAEAHDAVGTDEASRVLVLNVQGYLGLPLQHYLDDADKLRDEDDQVWVERIDVLVAQESSRPCNGLIGRACNLFFLGGIPPIVTAENQPDDATSEELQDWRAGVEANDMDEWVERIELDQFAIDRYQFDQPRLLSRDDLVQPRWDGKWKGLILATDPG